MRQGSANAPSHWNTDSPVPYRIRGADIQAVEFFLRPGQSVIAEPGTFLCSAGGIEGININWGKRLIDPLIRKWSGESSILQEFVCSPGSNASLILGAPQVGQVVRMRVCPGRSVICQRGAFIAASGDIQLGLAFTRRVRAGLFGGQGILFQRLDAPSGTAGGDVFLHGLGFVVDRHLASHTLMRVSTNNILAFEDTVGYDVQLSGGFLTLVLGGQGAFLSQLEGPGRVLVQSIDHDALTQNLRHSGKRRRKGRGKSTAAESGAESA